MIFQDPMTSLNPVFRAGWQVGEPLQLHKHMGQRRALTEAVKMFHKIGIPDPRQRARMFTAFLVLTIERRDAEPPRIRSITL